jgi:hypothetical protein
MNYPNVLIGWHDLGRPAWSADTAANQKLFQDEN